MQNEACLRCKFMRDSACYLNPPVLIQGQRGLHETDFARPIVSDLDFCSFFKSAEVVTDSGAKSTKPAAGQRKRGR